MKLNEPVDPSDRFAYGWRYVKKAGKNGIEKMVQVPLTLEDILHPQEEDFQIHSVAHKDDLCYLRKAFQIALTETPNSYILNECRIAWDEHGANAHGPDCAVIFNVREYGRWYTFNVAKEGTRPSLIIEVTSPHTRSTDLVNKVHEYAEQGVPHYVIADAQETEETRRVTLIDYHLSPDTGVYYSLPPSEEGQVWLPEVNLWLGVQDGQLVCHDLKGNRMRTVVEEYQEHIETKRKAAEERKALETRIKQLEEQVRSKNG